uniref:Uncharacterized protein n=1 Tax=Amphimedon queenslandica TaxID=400682 RepID=A0A1X7U5Z3_AMPQE
MVLMGLIMAQTFFGEGTSINKKTTTRERQKSFTLYSHGGMKVCKDTFILIHGIGEKRLNNVRMSFLENGLTSRKHGNTGKTPRHSLSADNKKEIVKFIKIYAEVHALMLPVRIPSVKEYAKTHLLLSIMTMMEVHKE